MKVSLTVNGKDVTADVEDRTLLVHFLRDTADLRRAQRMQAAK